MDPAKDPSKDLLSAALDICGLDFNFEEVSDEAPQSYSSESYEEPISESPVHHQHHNYASQPLQPTVVTPARSGSPNIIRFGPHLMTHSNGTPNYRINLGSLAQAGQPIQLTPYRKPSQITPHPEIYPSTSLLKSKSKSISKLKNAGDIQSKPQPKHSNSLLAPKSEPKVPPQPKIEPKKEPKPEEPPEDLDDEDDEFIQAETYADYRPTKLKIGIKHPDPVIETASLSSVAPPEVWYTLSIPEYLIDEGRLSALQLESIVYSCQQHEEFLPNGERAGFLIGDGAGVGKGRTIAGIIFENYLNSRKKAVWLSISSDLMWDSRRDLRDIGAEDIPVYQLNKFSYGKKFTYKEGKTHEKVKKGVIFATYASLISESYSGGGSLNTRLGQLLNWLGEDFDGLIVFDECHKAKNIFTSGTGKSTKTAQSVIDLQEKLPKARIVYASATGASEPRNMGYMTRLGLWGKGTTFPEFADFVNTVEKRGVGAMELIAVDLKLKGRYMARQLSFHGVNFRIERARMDRDFVKLYDKSVELWNEMRDKFEKALDLMDGDCHISKSIWTQFWASHQRFFKYLCIASKVRHTVRLAKEALRDDNCVVIGLQSTGEARTIEMLEDMDGELNDFLSTAKAVLLNLVEKHFPAPNRKKVLELLGRGNSIFDDLGLSLKRDKNGQLITVDNPDHKVESSSAPILDSSSDDDSDFESVSEEDDYDPDDELDKAGSFLLGFQNNGPKKRKRRRKKNRGPRAKRVRAEREKLKRKVKELNGNFMNEKSGEICSEMKEELIAKIEKLGTKLPPNTLDQLVDELGGVESVAEMTGRKGRIVSDEDGNVIYEKRTDNDVGMDLLNIIEKERFMKDEKRIAIISEAASSGISLHSDRRVENQRRRIHITIELPWSADRAIQQFGRTHRSNQVNAPEYVFLISDLAGEQRFASIVAKRLESLGALTHGDRRATESRDLSRFNIDNRYGREALELIMKSIVGFEKPIVDLPEYDGDFMEDVRDALVGVAIINLEGDDERPVLDKDYNNMNRFLNRLLGIQVDVQNALFRYFTGTMAAIINKARRVGRYDQGIMDLSREFGKVELQNVEKFAIKIQSQTLPLFLHHVSLERGLSWEDAALLYKNCSSAEEGFYEITIPKSKKKTIFLAVEDVITSNKEMKHVFRIYKPNTGLQSRTELVSSLRDKLDYKVKEPLAEPTWTEMYESSASKCLHKYLYGRCVRPTCDVGIRHRKYCVMSGSVLPVWPLLEKLVPALANRLQIARLHTADGLRVIGPLVPINNIDLLKLSFTKLEQMAQLKDKEKEKTSSEKDKSDKI